MRIGFVVVKSLFRGGGIESYTYEVGKRLVARGHEVVVFTMGHYGEVVSEVAGMQVVEVPCLRGAAVERITASMSGVIAALLQKPAISILHLHTPMTGAFGVIARIAGMPTVVQMHGVDWKRSRWGLVARTVIKGLEVAVMHSMPVCIGVSQSVCSFYEKQYGRQLECIPTGTQSPLKDAAADCIEALGLTPGKFVLFTSRLVPEKGAHYLISAFRHIRTDVKLVIAGGAAVSDSYMRNLFEVAQGDSRIIFPGFVEGRLKNQLLSHARIFVQPSEIEGLSIALLDAMSYGLPCLVSDIPENVEAIGDAGISFQCRSADDLRSKLNDLLTQEERCKHLGAEAQMRALREYSWDGVTDALESLYATHAEKLPTYVPLIESQAVGTAPQSRESEEAAILFPEPIDELQER